MIYAPIIIFAFNRLDALKACVAALQKNREAVESNLIVFVDGPRKHKDGEFENVEAVKEYVRSISGFKSIAYYFSKENKGLANSIIDGTTKIINQYGKVIVLEDDLVVSKSFLKYMNEMLNVFESDDRVMQISGYGSLLTCTNKYPYDVYLNERAMSWSWGTWKDRWDMVDWEVKDFKELSSSSRLQHSFNKRGTDLYKMLKDYMSGKNNSWYVRFNYSMFKQHRYSVQPIRSLVQNEGFGVNATHCNNYNRYKVDFEVEHEGDFKIDRHIEPCERLMSNSVRYWMWSYRIYGKVRTLWMKLSGKYGVKLDKKG